MHGVLFYLSHAPPRLQLRRADLERQLQPQKGRGARIVTHQYVGIYQSCMVETVKKGVVRT